MRIIYYVEINILCIAVLILVQSQLRYHQSQYMTSARKTFIGLSYTVIMLCISDIIAAVFRGVNMLGVRTVLEISNLLFFELLALGGYLWMLCVNLKLNLITEGDRRKMLWMAVPLFAFTALAVTNPITNVFFKIDENNLYIRGVGVYLHWAVVWFYLLVPAIQAWHALHKEDNRFRRNELTTIMSFVIPPFVAGLIQMLFYGISCTQVGVTISIVIVFLSIQKNQIFKDELTGLNNRRELTGCMEEHLKHDAGKAFPLLMLDINHFKQINDEFGHMTGDFALKEAADILKTACEQSGLKWFLCRYGGDEFIIVGNRCSMSDTERLQAAVRTEADSRNQNRKRPYKIEFSIGVCYDSCQNPDDFEQMLYQADAAMYAAKSSAKQTAKSEN